MDHVQIHNWLQQFPAGRQLSFALSSAIQQGKQLAQIYKKNEEIGGHSREFFVFDTKKFVFGKISLYDESNAQMNVHRISDITRINYDLGKLGQDWDRSIVSKMQTLVIDFKDGTSFTISSEDYGKYDDKATFDHFVSQILAL